MERLVDGLFLLWLKHAGPRKGRQELPINQLHFTNELLSNNGSVVESYWILYLENELRSFLHAWYKAERLLQALICVVLCKDVRGLCEIHSGIHSSQLHWGSIKVYQQGWRFSSSTNWSSIIWNAKNASSRLLSDTRMFNWVQRTVKGMDARKTQEGLKRKLCPPLKTFDITLRATKYDPIGCPGSSESSGQPWGSRAPAKKKTINENFDFFRPKTNR